MSKQLFANGTDVRIAPPSPPDSGPCVGPSGPPPAGDRGRAAGSFVGGLLTGWADRCRGKRKYRRALAFALTTVERARMALEDVRLEAEVYPATQHPAWAETAEGAEYLAALRGLGELIARMGEWQPPDLSVLR